MRTAAAARSAVTSAASLLPQPNQEELTSPSNETSAPAPEVSADNSRSSGTMVPFSMNTADMLAAYNGGGSSRNFSNGGGGADEGNESTAMMTAEAAAAAGFGAGTVTGPSTGTGIGQSMYHAAGFGMSPHIDVSSGTRRLARELEEFVERGLEGALAAERGDPGAPSEDAIAELQLQTARKLRQLLPTNRDLLHLVQERNWIPLLLGWLNLHERPAVQVEALLALTNIAELCAQQSYYHHSVTQNHPSLVSSAHGAAGGGSNLLTSQDCAMDSDTPPSYYSFPPPSSEGQAGGNGSTSVVPAPNNSANPQSPGAVVLPTAGPYVYPAANGVLPAGASLPFAPLYPPGGSETGTGDPATHGGGGQAAFGGFSSPSFANALSPAPAAGAAPARGAGRDGGDVTASFSAPAPAGPSNALTTETQGTAAAAPSGNSTALVSAPGSSVFLPPTPTIPSNILAASGGGSGGVPQPLSASSQHLLLRHADAIPTLISLLASPSREVHEQAMWILGSIAAGESSTSSTGASGSTTGGNGAGGSGSSGGSGSGSGSSGGSGSGSGEKSSSVAARDVVLAAGVMLPLLRCLEANPHNLSLQRIGGWALSNLVEGQFQQNGSKSGSGSKANSAGSSGGGSDYLSSDEIEMKSLLPTLRRLLHTADAEVLSYTCWTLSHLCDGPSSHIAAVVTTVDPNGPPGGLVPRLVDLLLHPSWRVTKPALRTIGNIVCAECSDDGNNHGDGASPPSPTDYTEVILDCDAVPRLKHLITHSNREIQKEACWTLSNIAAGTVDQIQAVIDSGAIPPLVELVSDKNTDQEVRSEACWVVLNATSCGSDHQIEVLVDEGCVSVLGVLLGEASMVMMALEGLERVLQVEESREIARKARLAARRASELAGHKMDDQDDDDEERPPTLVSASLIEKALEKHNSNAVSKRAGRIWKQHFVSCALCKQSYSRHRTTDATFCEECKCHVCSNCDCRVYHLSFQEELWAEKDEKPEGTKKSKKNKKKKKKEKQKAKAEKAKEEKKAKQVPSVPVKDKAVSRSQSSTITLSSDSRSGAGNGGGAVPAAQQQSKCPPVKELSVVSSSANNGKIGKKAPIVSISSEITSDKPAKSVKKSKKKVATSSASPVGAEPMHPAENESGNAMRKARGKASPSPSLGDEDDVGIGADVTMTPEGEGEGQDQPPVDFVNYLQQTGSIIALAKLMDALEYGDSADGYDEEVDAELQMLSKQQHFLPRQATA